MCGPSTADLVHAAAETRYRAERGYASDLDAADGDVGNWSDLAGTHSEFDPIAITRAAGESNRREWSENCDTCGRAYRRNLYGLTATVADGVGRILEDDEEQDADVDDGLDIRLEGCPF